MSPDLIDKWVNLFRGRGDVYGSWTGMAVREELTRGKLEAHLTSDDPADWIGVYPLLGDQCSWGCIDIDGGDFPGEGSLDDPHYDRKDPQWHDWKAMYQLAENLREALAFKGVYGYIERTRNGYHVWVFPDEPLVSAATMRRALMAACTVCDYDPKEVNPKQESLKHGQIGNYVRLPYNGYLAPNSQQQVTKERRFVHQGAERVGLEDFLDWVQRTPIAALQAVANLWTPPERPTTHVDTGVEYDGDEPVAVRFLSGLAYTIWRDGPLQGKDRSDTLAQLAHLCAEQGLIPQQAYDVLRTADARWGKFYDRADCEEQLLRLIENAY